MPVSATPTSSTFEALVMQAVALGCAVEEAEKIAAAAVAQAVCELLEELAAKGEVAA